MSRDGWEDILDPGEEILWQGRPQPGVAFRFDQPREMVMGLIFMGFSTFWMLGAAQGGGPFWMFGLIFFATGAWQAGGRFVWGAIKRGRTWYTLTTRRAFVATDLPIKGKTLSSYPITTDSAIDYVPGPNASIYFAKGTETRKKHTVTTDIGFERIADAPKVYRLMRDIQGKGAA